MKRTGGIRHWLARTRDLGRADDEPVKCFCANCCARDPTREQQRAAHERGLRALATHGKNWRQLIPVTP